LLIVTAMFVTIRCSNDIGNDEFTPPPGMGAVKLSFDEKIARTILPDDATLATFDEFEFIFTVTSGGTAKTVSNIALANLYDPITLDPGIYNLVVIAYIDVGSPGSPSMQPAATNGTGTSVTIQAGKVATETITLTVYDPVVGKTGTFTYTLDNANITSADITTATMTLTSIGTGTNQGPIDIKSQFTGTPNSLTVATGFYYVDFVLVVGGDTVTFRHVVHIYQNMTSSYTFTIGLSYFNATFKLESGDIVFDINDLKPAIEYEIDSSGSQISYTEGATINFTRGEVIVFTVINASIFTANSYEWYYLNATSKSSTATCTINTTGLAAKDYFLTVVGLRTADSKKYATVVNFTVEP